MTGVVGGGGGGDFAVTPKCVFYGTHLNFALDSKRQTVQGKIAHEYTLNSI